MPEYEIIPVKHELTGEEKKAIADSIVKKVLKVKELEEEKKEFDKARGEEIKGEQAVIRSLSAQYDQGFVTDKKRCEVRRNFETKNIEYVDTETGEVVKERTMTPEECQMSFTVVRDKESSPVAHIGPGTGER
ncbi:MAG: hypothetical protein JW984_15110 [Deltaproteobacteria bacterium]|uniref:Uncharacterized protein n=1 Tax=Candidatus Zymogenus saltonus TaxID=2844893 RepID=A0A9D8KH05_9DELT|nr:hypothetical protein [Candidatus Zymogenus saltonus]